MAGNWGVNLGSWGPDSVPQCHAASPEMLAVFIVSITLFQLEFHPRCGPSGFIDSGSEPQRAYSHAGAELCLLLQEHHLPGQDFLSEVEQCPRGSAQHLVVVRGERRSEEKRCSDFASFSFFSRITVFFSLFLLVFICVTLLFSLLVSPSLQLDVSVSLFCVGLLHSIFLSLPPTCSLSLHLSFRFFLLLSLSVSL